MTEKGAGVLAAMAADGWRIVATPGRRPRFYHPERDIFGDYVHGQTLNSLAGDGLVEMEEFQTTVSRVYAITSEGRRAISED